MRIGFLAAGAAVTVCVAGAVMAQQAQPQAQRPRGYLSAAEAPEAALILPPAPTAGDRYETDRHVFAATRALKDSPRWQLAQADNSYQTPYLLRAFSCSVGANLTPQNAPTVARLIGRSIVDTGASSRTAKDVFKRKRPYLIDEGDICIDKSASLAESPDYPSGHATLGWTTGLILAQLAPDRSTQILTRARAYGESRVVCGVHNSSAIEGARTTGAAVFAALNGNAEYRADVDKARAEVAAARTAGAPDAATCQAEAALIAKTPYPQ